MKLQPSSISVLVTDDDASVRRLLRLFIEGAGFKVHTYPYYDATTGGLKFGALMDTVRSLPAQSIVLLHACCHNPTGVDLNAAQWTQLIGVLKARKLLPFLDIEPEKLGPVERAVLRIATYELKARIDVPYRVVINEAVALAKKFGATDSHRFVNAVLNHGLVDQHEHLFGLRLCCGEETGPKAGSGENRFANGLRHPVMVTRRVVGSITFEPSP